MENVPAIKKAMLLDPRFKNRLIKDESEKEELNQALILEMERNASENNIAEPKKQANSTKKSNYHYNKLIIIIILWKKLNKNKTTKTNNMKILATIFKTKSICILLGLFKFIICFILDESKSKVLAFLDKIQEEDGVLDSEKSFKEELERYMSQPVVSRKTDIFQWWKSNESIFPNVAKLARHYLCIPATQVNSERLFSGAGDTIDKNRSQLLPFHAEQICFLKANLILED